MCAYMCARLPSVLPLYCLCVGCTSVSLYATCNYAYVSLYVCVCVSLYIFVCMCRYVYVYVFEL